MTSSIQPGWHDDPEDASAQRYWDGQAWTPLRRRKPLSGQPPAPSAAAAPVPTGFPPPPAPPTPQQPPSRTPPEVTAQYGQPPGQWAPLSPQAPAVTAKGGGSGKKALLTVAAVVVLIVGVGVALAVSGAFSWETKKLAVAEIQTEVRKVLVDRVTGYTSSDIKEVTCNNGQDPTVKQGGSFTCNVTDRGKQHRLTVTFTDGNGTYEVGLPQLSGGK